jgi:hypothetical protein
MQTCIASSSLCFDKTKTMSGTVAFFNDRYSCGTDIRGIHPLQIGEAVNYMCSVLTGIKTPVDIQYLKISGSYQLDSESIVALLEKDAIYTLRIYSDPGLRR